VRVSVNSSEVNEGLSKLRKCLKNELGNPVMQMWNFPGGGGEKLPTWYRKGSDPLTVAIGSNDFWETRTPIFISRKPLKSVMTPDVEVNIPTADGNPNRAVNGCFSVTGSGSFVLCHRGNGFTVAKSKISKDRVHGHFKKWLVKIQDSKLETWMIPVGPVNSDIVDQLCMFTDEVLGLKESWSKKSRHANTAQKWRDTLRFPKKIERIVTASSTSREYRHGPIQAALKRKLLEVLDPSRCRVVLNNHVDLGILQGNKLVSIFEIKTDLGDQLYAGIGQLIVYRHYFGDTKTRLFLVVPADVRKSGNLSEVGTLLGKMGINCLVRDGNTISQSNGKALVNALSKQWLR